MKKFGIISVLASLLLSGCMSLAPDYQRPVSPVPETLSGSGSASIEEIEAQINLGWDSFFTDPDLRHLIQQGLANNRDLKIALFKVAEARQQAGIQNSERFLKVDALLSTEYNGQNREKLSQDYQGRLNASLELDFFGRLKSMSDAELQRYFATVSSQRSTLLLLVSQITEAYLAEQVARQQLALATRNLTNYQQSYRIIEQQIQSGKASFLALEQARGMIEMAKITQAEKKKQAEQQKNQLELLVGNYLLPTNTNASLETLIKTTLPAEIPSSILLKRPDIQEAEHQLLAANADIGAARAAFFPTISLTGNLGNTSMELSSLFSGPTGWQFMPTVSIPLFTAGKNKATLELAEIRKERAVTEYEKTIQTAFKEVKDALTAREAYLQQIAAQKRYLTSQRNASELAVAAYISGTTSYQEVLETQRNIFSSEQDLLALNQAYLLNEVNLFIALGGGLNN